MTKEKRENKIWRAFRSNYGQIEKDAREIADIFYGFRYGWLSGYRARRKENKTRR